MKDIINNNWDNESFQEMNWYDNRLYSVIFNTQEFKLLFDIDYIIEWSESWDKFLIAPCKLCFDNVSDTRINIYFGNTQSIIIDSIKREGECLSPNGKLKQWFYTVETNVGDISFWATGYSQTANSSPIWHEYRDLNRKMG